MRRRAISALALLGLGALFGAAASIPATAEVRPGWTEVKWTFPVDQWGAGKAFHCDARACGTDINLYLRAKIGFCNCQTGVADDQELDRVADFDLFGDRPAALAPGHPIEVRWMKGRSRAYRYAGSAVDGKSTLTIAFNDRCDVIVATVTAARDRVAEVEVVALEFLNGDIVIRWAEKALGL